MLSPNSLISNPNFDGGFDVRSHFVCMHACVVSALNKLVIYSMMCRMSFPATEIAQGAWRFLDIRYASTIEHRIWTAILAIEILQV
jgi:hypothetical protein